MFGKKKKYLFKPNTLIRCFDENKKLIEFLSEEKVLEEDEKVILQILKKEGVYTTRTSLSELRKKFNYVTFHRLIK